MENDIKLIKIAKNHWQAIRNDVIGEGKTKDKAYLDLLETERFIRISKRGKK